jgi:hypothetical protein
MSYSSLNDAFNINSDFEKTIRGLNSFNPMNNTFENIKSSNKSNLSESNPQFESNYFGNVKAKNCDPNYQNNFYNPNDPLPIIDGMYSGDDNLSWESLNGTDLYSRGDNITSNSLSNKLTHRDCIKIYNNPDSYNDVILSKALKHVSKCKDCKEGIKNSMIDETNKKISLNSNSNSKSLPNIKKSSSNNQDNLSLLSTYKNFHNPLNSGSLNLSSQSQSQSQSSNSKIESELKMLSEKINGETNLKYQNALIQSNISKYLEDLEERKKINNKLDKIMDMIKYDFVSKQENQNNKSNISSEFKDSNILNLLTSTQFLTNLSKINELNNTSNQQNTTNQQNTSYESYLLYIGIFVIIVLLIIDIVLRFNTKIN